MYPWAVRSMADALKLKFRAGSPGRSLAIGPEMAAAGVCASATPGMDTLRVSVVAIVIAVKTVRVSKHSRVVMVPPEHARVSMTLLPILLWRHRDRCYTDRRFENTGAHSEARGSRKGERCR